METSYEYFKKIGCKEVPLSQVPKDYGWITGCGGPGGYYNFFMQVDQLPSDGIGYSDKDNQKVLIAKVA
jgi:hypothetical protein